MSALDDETVELVDRRKLDDLADEFADFRTAVRQYRSAKHSYLSHRNDVAANDYLQKLRSHERALDRLLRRYSDDAPLVTGGEGV